MSHQARDRAPSTNEASKPFHNASFGSIPHACQGRRSSRDAGHVGEPQTCQTTGQRAPNVPELAVDTSTSDIEMTIPPNLKFDTSKIKILQRATPIPPVTRETLTELDLNRIMNNINLRMDANFDRDLHFRPDLDGPKGEEKRRKAEEYWMAMALEFEIYAYNAMNGGASLADSLRSFEPRLPAMFETLKDVLMSLVPERDHAAIITHLDVPFLMQEIEKGVLDMVGLAKWLSTLLKTHCAPMRDEWADRMVQKIETGFQAQDMAKVVEGLKQLFGIMEIMKLDVANHQIRAFRVLLVEETVPFLRSYFTKKMRSKQFDPSAARQWYLSSRRRESRHSEEGSAPRSQDYPMATLLRSLIQLLVSSKRPVSFPETFYFDDSRLWRARLDIQDMINSEVCGRIFEDLVTRMRPESKLTPQDVTSLKRRVRALLENMDTYTPRDETSWVDEVDSIALEISRTAFVHCGYNPKLIGSDLLDMLERALHENFTSSRNAPLVHKIRSETRDYLENATLQYAFDYSSMTPLAICEAQLQNDVSEAALLSQISGRMRAARSGQFTTSGPARTTTLEPCFAGDVSSVAKRIAHVGVLHWRVWGVLLYEMEDEQAAAAREERAAREEMNGDTTMSENEE